MKSKSLKSNFIMYSIRIMSGTILSLITFPYVSQKLGPEGIGRVQYVQSIVSYFLLFINIGIPVYGYREVAVNRENKEKMSKIVLELISILIITTSIVSIIYVVSLLYLPVMQKEKILFIIFGIQILMTFMDLEWFFRGIENQNYITIRSMLVKIFSLIAILIFIKNSNDYYKYALILVLSLVGSNMFNLLKVFKNLNVQIFSFKNLQIKKHLKPLLIFFSSNIALSLFYSVDSIMLGSMIGEKELGYYSLASNIGRMPIIFITAITGVLSPRLCNYIKNDKIEDYYELAKKGLSFLLLFSFPATIGMYILAPEIIQVLGGEKFSNSINPLKIYSFLLLTLSLAYYVGAFIFTPNNMEKYGLYSFIIAGVFNIVFNYIFIPKFKSSGAAMGTVLSELLACVIRIYMVTEIIKKIKNKIKEILKIIISSLLMGIFLIIIKKIILITIIRLIIGITTSIIIYFILLVLLKEENIIDILGKVKKEEKNVKKDL